MTNFLQVTGFNPLIVSEPQGPQGPQGQPGPVGPTGAPGGIQPTGSTATSGFKIVDPSDSSIELNFYREAGSTAFTVNGKAGAPADLGLIAPNGTDYADFTYDGANADIDASVGNINVRPLAGGTVNIWSLSGGAPVLKVGNQGLTQALTLQHDGTNAHVSATTGYIGLQSDNFQVLPTGAVNYIGPTAAAATAGTNGTPPAQVGGYLTWQVGGTTVKIPYYLS